MTNQNQEKSTSVKVIGWFLLLVSVYSILMLLVGILMNSGSDAATNEFVSRIRILPEPLHTIYNGIGYFTAPLLLVSSIYFLKLRRWARLVLEILTWKYVTEMFVFTTMFLLVWKEDFFRLMEAQMGQSLNHIYSNFLAGAIAFIGVLFAAVGIIIILYLRSKRIRSAMVS